MNETGYPYVYRWNRQGRKNQRCRVTARGKLNSIEVEFADGFTMISSRNSVIKARRREQPEKQSEGSHATGKREHEQ
jgi:hypothetical protein